VGGHPFTVALNIMNIAPLVGQKLNTVWVSHPRIQPHAAWSDQTTPDIQSLFVNLACTGVPVVRVVPCEVDDPLRFPALGIELQEVDDSPDYGRWYEGTLTQAEVLSELASYLPAVIVQVRLWDAMGDGPDSALDVVLENGIKLTVRHIMPPMSLGIEIFNTVKNTEA
jgi:hypothetical protein